MSVKYIDGVIITPLNKIYVPGGYVLHAMKAMDEGYVGFGEAYFSSVESGSVKAWKRHHQMVLNIVVPFGAIRFVMFDDRYSSASYGFVQTIELSLENYCRLTIPPMVWLGFQGLSNKTSFLLNIANIPHVKNECDHKQISEIDFDWS